MTSVNDDKVLQLFQSMIQDPFYEADSKRSREEVVLQEAMQRIRQFNNNEKALGMAVDDTTSSAVKSLFEFIQLKKAAKKSDESEDTPQARINSILARATPVYEGEKSRQPTEKEYFEDGYQTEGGVPVRPTGNKDYMDKVKLGGPSETPSESREERVPIFNAGVTNKTRKPIEVSENSIIKGTDKEGNLLFMSEIPLDEKKGITFPLSAITKATTTGHYSYPIRSFMRALIGDLKNLGATPEPNPEDNDGKRQNRITNDLATVKTQLQKVKAGESQDVFFLHGKDDANSSRSQTVSHYIDFWRKSLRGTPLQNIFTEWDGAREVANKKAASINGLFRRGVETDDPQIKKNISELERLISDYQSTSKTLFSTLIDREDEYDVPDTTVDRTIYFDEESSKRLLRLKYAQALAASQGDLENTPYNDFFKGLRFSGEELTEDEINNNEDVSNLEKIHFGNSKKVTELLSDVEERYKDTNVGGVFFNNKGAGVPIAKWNPFPNTKDGKEQFKLFQDNLSQHVQNIKATEQAEIEQEEEGVSPKARRNVKKTSDVRPEKTIARFAHIADILNTLDTDYPNSVGKGGSEIKPDGGYEWKQREGTEGGIELDRDEELASFKEAFKKATSVGRPFEEFLSFLSAYSELAPPFNRHRSSLPAFSQRHIQYLPEQVLRNFGTIDSENARPSQINKFVAMQDLATAAVNNIQIEFDNKRFRIGGGFLKNAPQIIDKAMKDYGPDAVYSIKDMDAETRKEIAHLIGDKKAQTLPASISDKDWQDISTSKGSPDRRREVLNRFPKKMHEEIFLTANYLDSLIRLVADGGQGINFTVKIGRDERRLLYPFNTKGGGSRSAVIKKLLETPIEKNPIREILSNLFGSGGNSWYKQFAESHAAFPAYLNNIGELTAEFNNKWERAEITREAEQKPEVGIDQEANTDDPEEASQWTAAIFSQRRQRMARAGETQVDEDNQEDNDIPEITEEQRQALRKHIPKFIEYLQGDPELSKFVEDVEILDDDNNVIGYKDAEALHAPFAVEPLFNERTRRFEMDENKQPLKTVKFYPDKMDINVLRNSPQLLEKFHNLIYGTNDIVGFVDYVPSLSLFGNSFAQAYVAPMKKVTKRGIIDNLMLQYANETGFELEEGEEEAAEALQNKFEEEFGKTNVNIPNTMHTYKSLINDIIQSYSSSGKNRDRNIVEKSAEEVASEIFPILMHGLLAPADVPNEETKGHIDSAIRRINRRNGVVPFHTGDAKEILKVLHPIFAALLPEDDAEFTEDEKGNWDTDNEPINEAIDEALPNLLEFTVPVGSDQADIIANSLRQWVMNYLQHWNDEDVKDSEGNEIWFSEGNFDLLREDAQGYMAPVEAEDAVFADGVINDCLAFVNDDSKGWGVRGLVANTFSPAGLINDQYLDEPVYAFLADNEPEIDALRKLFGFDILDSASGHRKLVSLCQKIDEHFAEAREKDEDFTGTLLPESLTKRFNLVEFDKSGRAKIDGRGLVNLVRDVCFIPENRRHWDNSAAHLPQLEESNEILRDALDKHNLKFVSEDFSRYEFLSDLFGILNQSIREDNEDWDIMPSLIAPQNIFKRQFVEFLYQDLLGSKGAFGSNIQMGRSGYPKFGRENDSMFAEKDKASFLINLLDTFGDDLAEMPFNPDIDDAVFNRHSVYHLDHFVSTFMQTVDNWTRQARGLMATQQSYDADRVKMSEIGEQEPLSQEYQAKRDFEFAQYEEFIDKVTDAATGMQEHYINQRRNYNNTYWTNVKTSLDAGDTSALPAPEVLNYWFQRLQSTGEGGDVGLSAIMSPSAFVGPREPLTTVDMRLIPFDESSFYVRTLALGQGLKQRGYMIPSEQARKASGDFAGLWAQMYPENIREYLQNGDGQQILDMLNHIDNLNSIAILESSKGLPQSPALAERRRMANDQLKDSQDIYMQGLESGSGVNRTNINTNLGNHIIEEMGKLVSDKNHGEHINNFDRHILRREEYEKKEIPEIVINAYKNFQPDEEHEGEFPEEFALLDDDAQGNMYLKDGTKNPNYLKGMSAENKLALWSWDWRATPSERMAEEAQRIIQTSQATRNQNNAENVNRVGQPHMQEVIANRPAKAASLDSLDENATPTWKQYLEDMRDNKSEGHSGFRNHHEVIHPGDPRHTANPIIGDKTFKLLEEHDNDPKNANQKVLVEGSTSKDYKFTDDFQNIISSGPQVGDKKQPEAQGRYLRHYVQNSLEFYKKGGRVDPNFEEYENVWAPKVKPTQIDKPTGETSTPSITPFDGEEESGVEPFQGMMLSKARQSKDPSSAPQRMQLQTALKYFRERMGADNAKYTEDLLYQLTNEEDMTADVNKQMLESILTNETFGLSADNAGNIAFSPHLNIGQKNRETFTADELAGILQTYINKPSKKPVIFEPLVMLLGGNVNGRALEGWNGAYRDSIAKHIAISKIMENSASKPVQGLGSELNSIASTWQDAHNNIVGDVFKVKVNPEDSQSTNIQGNPLTNDNLLLNRTQQWLKLMGIDDADIDKNLDAGTLSYRHSSDGEYIPLDIDKLKDILRQGISSEIIQEQGMRSPNGDNWANNKKNKVFDIGEDGQLGKKAIPASLNKDMARYLIREAAQQSGDTSMPHPSINPPQGVDYVLPEGYQRRGQLIYDTDEVDGGLVLFVNGEPIRAVDYQQEPVRNIVPQTIPEDDIPPEDDPSGVQPEDDIPEDGQQIPMFPEDGDPSGVQDELDANYDKPPEWDMPDDESWREEDGRYFHNDRPVVFGPDGEPSYEDDFVNGVYGTSIEPPVSGVQEEEDDDDILDHRFPPDGWVKPEGDDKWTEQADGTFLHNGKAVVFNENGDATYLTDLLTDGRYGTPIPMGVQEEEEEEEEETIDEEETTDVQEITDFPVDEEGNPIATNAFGEPMDDFANQDILVHEQGTRESIRTLLTDKKTGELVMRFKGTTPVDLDGEPLELDSQTASQYQSMLRYWSLPHRDREMMEHYIMNEGATHLDQALVDFTHLTETEKNNVFKRHLSTRKKRLEEESGREEREEKARRKMDAITRMREQHQEMHGFDDSTDIENLPDKEYDKYVTNHQKEYKGFRQEQSVKEANTAIETLLDEDGNSLFSSNPNRQDVMAQARKLTALHANYHTRWTPANMKNFNTLLKELSEAGRNLNINWSSKIKEEIGEFDGSSEERPLFGTPEYEEIIHDRELEHAAGHQKYMDIIQGDNYTDMMRLGHEKGDAIDHNQFYAFDKKDSEQKHVVEQATLNPDGSVSRTHSANVEGVNVNDVSGLDDLSNYGRDKNLLDKYANDEMVIQLKQWENGKVFKQGETDITNEANWENNPAAAKQLLFDNIRWFEDKSGNKIPGAYHPATKTWINPVVYKDLREHKTVGNLSGHTSSEKFIHGGTLNDEGHAYYMMNDGQLVLIDKTVNDMENEGRNANEPVDRSRLLSDYFSHKVHTHMAQDPNSYNTPVTTYHAPATEEGRRAYSERFAEQQPDAGESRMDRFRQFVGSGRYQEKPVPKGSPAEFNPWDRMSNYAKFKRHLGDELGSIPVAGKVVSGIGRAMRFQNPFSQNPNSVDNYYKRQIDNYKLENDINQNFQRQYGKLHNIQDEQQIPQYYGTATPTGRSRTQMAAQSARFTPVNFMQPPPQEQSLEPPE